MNTKTTIPRQVWSTDRRSDEPNPNDLDSIEDTVHHPEKPVGGIWTSTYTPDNNFDSDWIQWCVREDFCEVHHKFLLIPEDRLNVLVIDSTQDLREIFDVYEKDEYTSPLDDRAINFFQISKDFDAIHLTTHGKEETNNFFQNINLCSWDTETVLSFRWNWRAVEYLGLSDFG